MENDKRELQLRVEKILGREIKGERIVETVRALVEIIESGKPTWM